jgi:hypothetical protein
MSRYEQVQEKLLKPLMQPGQLQTNARASKYKGYLQAKRRSRCHGSSRDASSKWREYLPKKFSKFFAAIIRSHIIVAEK